MHEPLKSPENSNVLVVETASSVRQMIIDSLKDFGFRNIYGSSSGKDALHYLEVERVDWMIVSISTVQSDDVNGLQLLKMLTRHPKLKNVRTSFLLDLNSDGCVLSLAFELGLLSWHPKSYIREQIITELQSLFDLMKAYDWNMTLVSAEFIRKHLYKINDIKSRLVLEENLLSLFPGYSRILYYLAEAEILNGNQEVALSILEQTKLLDSKIGEHCDRLAKHYGLSPSTLNSTIENSKKQNVLNLKFVVLIDPDTDVLYNVKDLLVKAGVEEVECFENGSNAFFWLSNSKKHPDLIIMEWRITGISGLSLVQKIRSMGLVQTPIVITSSLIDTNDYDLLREVGVDKCLAKPFDHHDFYATIIWAIQQNKSPTEQKTLHLKIRRLLEGGRTGEAERLIAQFLEDGRIKSHAKIEVEAEYQWYKGNYTATVKLGMQAIAEGGDSLLMLNLVGKAMLKKKNYAEAIKCFERANQLSSLNVERMLNLAEASLYAEDVEKAELAIDEAKKIDHVNEDINQMESKIKLEKGEVEAAKKMISDIDSGKDIVSYMNNRAVSLSYAGRFEDAIELYKKTLNTVPEKWKNLHTLIRYNLGLAYAKYGKLEDAKTSLEQIYYLMDKDIEKKINSLLKRVKKCIATGKRMEIKYESNQDLLGTGNESEPTDASVPLKEEELIPDMGDIVARLEAKRGDICCYMIFLSIVEIDPRARKLIAKEPRFMERKAIKRD